MGIIDAILGPIKDVIRGLTKPVKTVEHVFGEIIDLTEDVVKDMEDMLTEITSLFNASKVEVLFLSPFKTAALDAVGSIDKLFLLLAKVSAITVDGVEAELMTSINASYAGMKDSLTIFKGVMRTMIQDIADEESSLGKTLEHEFTRIAAAIETLPTEIKLLSKKVVTEFKVVADKGMSIVPEFGEFAEKEATSAFATVKRAGTTTVDDFDALEKSIRDKIANETAQIDLFALVVAGLLLALVVGIFMITKSFIVITIIVALLLISVLVWVLVDRLRPA